MIKEEKVKCQWCGGNKLPFHKLNIHMYGNHRFICENCYIMLETQQSLYDNEFKLIIKKTVNGKVEEYIKEKR